MRFNLFGYIPRRLRCAIRVARTTCCPGARARHRERTGSCLCSDARSATATYALNSSASRKISFPSMRPATLPWFFPVHSLPALLPPSRSKNRRPASGLPCRSLGCLSLKGRGSSKACQEVSRRALEFRISSNQRTSYGWPLDDKILNDARDRSADRGLGLARRNRGD